MRIAWNTVQQHNIEEGSDAVNVKAADDELVVESPLEDEYCTLYTFKIKNVRTVASVLYIHVRTK